ncbi:Aintegumenta [Heracleum sosnowskyi]|uniref:Aintegumenta n=1 Tax=Heracleum sosnowskyi TaxID=360622 RepID=A0AAD8GPM9_9APIA|nr:Aintegumenta [Heracleum sosnowskyi]
MDHFSFSCANPSSESISHTISCKKNNLKDVEEGDSAPAIEHPFTKELPNINCPRDMRLIYGIGAHLWDRGAHAYDLAALKYWGLATMLNFPVELYEKDIEEMKNSTKEEYVASLKRKSSGFSWGASKYKGVFKHQLRWEARVKRMDGKRYTYLGKYEGVVIWCK